MGADVSSPPNSSPPLRRCFSSPRYHQGNVLDSHNWNEGETRIDCQGDENVRPTEMNWLYLASSLPSIFNRLSKCCLTTQPTDLIESFATRRAAVMRGRELVGEKQFTKAIRVYQTALHLPPQSAEIDGRGLVDEGEGVRREGLVDEGEGVRRDSQGESSQSPTVAESDHIAAEDDAQIYAELGEVYFAARQVESAMQALDHAHLLAPDDLDILYKKAVVLNACGEYTSVLGVLSHAVEINSYFAQAYFLLGLASRQLDRYQQASDYLEILLIIEPNRSDALTLLADCCEQQARYHDAVAYLERAIQLDPDDHSARRALDNVLLLLRKQRSECAPQETGQLIQRKPLNVEAWEGENNSETQELAEVELQSISVPDASKESGHEWATIQYEGKNIPATKPSSEAQTRVGSMESLIPDNSPLLTHS